MHNLVLYHLGFKSDYKTINADVPVGQFLLAVV